MNRGFRNATLIVTVFLLGLAVPMTIQDNVKRGSFYLFTDQFWDDLLLRFQGAGRFRFLMQPAVALILGWISGRKDAARGHHGYLRRIVSRQEGWRESLKHGFDTIGMLLIMGVLADIVVQYILLGIVHVAPAILLGPLFVSVPYAFSRGISSRIKMRGSADQGRIVRQDGRSW